MDQAQPATSAPNPTSVDSFVRGDASIAKTPVGYCYVADASVFVNGRPLARRADDLDIPGHDIGGLVNVSPNVEADGRGIGRECDVAIGRAKGEVISPEELSADVLTNEDGAPEFGEAGGPRSPFEILDQLLLNPNLSREELAALDRELEESRAAGDDEWGVGRVAQAEICAREGRTLGGLGHWVMLAPDIVLGRLRWFTRATRVRRVNKARKMWSKRNYEVIAQGIFTGKGRKVDRVASNRQLAKWMEQDSRFRKQMEDRFGKNVYKRTRSGRNPEGAEWHHTTKKEDAVKQEQSKAVLVDRSAHRSPETQDLMHPKDSSGRHGGGMRDHGLK